MTRDKIQTSKFLSLVLRHQPERIGLALDENGWADVDELIERAAAHGVTLTRELIAEIVAGSDKQRFALDAAAERIRANQGHSVDIDIDLGLEPTEPPAILFHGTAATTVSAIRSEGLNPANASTCTCPGTNPPPSRSGSGTAGLWCCACLPVRCGNREHPSIARRMVYG